MEINEIKKIALFGQGRSGSQARDLPRTECGGFRAGNFIRNFAD